MGEGSYSLADEERGKRECSTVYEAKIDICRTSRGLLRKYKHGELACFSVEALSRREGQRDVGGRIHVRG